MRETAILLALGIAMLGFSVDRAIADLRMGRMRLLVFVTAMLNIDIDGQSWLNRS